MATFGLVSSIFLILQLVALNVNGQAVINNRIYILQSEADGTVLDLTNWITTNGNPIINLAPNGATAQRWRATLDNAGYRLATIVESTTCLPIIDSSSTGAIIINCFNGARNQQWDFIQTGITGAVPNYAIYNLAYGCVLQNNGAGRQASCVAFNTNLVPTNQRWRFNLSA